MAGEQARINFCENREKIGVTVEMSCHPISISRISVTVSAKPQSPMGGRLVRVRDIVIDSYHDTDIHRGLCICTYTVSDSYHYQ